MKTARFILAVFTIIAFIGAIAEYLSENPHVGTLHAIAVVSGMLVLFLFGYLFMLFILHVAMDS